MNKSQFDQITSSISIQDVDFLKSMSRDAYLIVNRDRSEYNEVISLGLVSARPKNDKMEIKISPLGLDYLTLLGK